MTPQDKRGLSEIEAIDLELKKIQLMRESLALHDELRKRQRKVAIHDGVANAAGGLVRKIGAAMEQKAAQREAERQRQEQQRELEARLRAVAAEQKRQFRIGLEGE